VKNHLKHVFIDEKEFLSSFELFPPVEDFKNNVFLHY